MIDVHCHLNFHSFQEDYDEVINRAFEKGLTKIINTGTQITSSKEAVRLADAYNDLYAIVGVHPHHADKLAQVEKAQSVIQASEERTRPESDSGVSPIKSGIPRMTMHNNIWL